MALIKKDVEITIDAEANKVVKKSSLKILGITISASKKSVDSWFEEQYYSALFSL